MVVSAYTLLMAESRRMLDVASHLEERIDIYEAVCDIHEKSRILDEARMDDNMSAEDLLAAVKEFNKSHIYLEYLLMSVDLTCKKRYTARSNVSRVYKRILSHVRVLGVNSILMPDGYTINDSTLELLRDYKRVSDIAGKSINSIVFELTNDEVELLAWVENSITMMEEGGSYYGKRASTE